MYYICAKSMYVDTVILIVIQLMICLLCEVYYVLQYV